MNSHWRHPSDPTPFKLGPTTRDKIIFWLSAGVVALIVALAFTCAATMAAEMPKATTECPNPGEACKIVVLTPQEESILTRQGGILDTAASARFLDLGNPVSYFRMKLLQAPAGEVRQLEKKPEPPKAEVKPAEGSSTDK